MPSSGARAFRSGGAQAHGHGWSAAEPVGGMRVASSCRPEGAGAACAPSGRSNDRVRLAAPTAIDRGTGRRMRVRQDAPYELSPPESTGAGGVEGTIPRSVKDQDRCSRQRKNAESRPLDRKTPFMDSGRAPYRM
nr:hypothetical protein fc91 [uncultured bacterium]